MKSSYTLKLSFTSVSAAALLALKIFCQATGKGRSIDFCVAGVSLLCKPGQKSTTYYNRGVELSLTQLFKLAQILAESVCLSVCVSAIFAVTAA